MMEHLIFNPLIVLAVFDLFPILECKFIDRNYLFDKNSVKSVSQNESY